MIAGLFDLTIAEPDNMVCTLGCLRVMRDEKHSPASRRELAKMVEYEARVPGVEVASGFVSEK